MNNKTQKVNVIATDYQKQAIGFAIKHGIIMTILETDYGKHFAEDKQCRFVFKIKLTRKGKSYTFKFGQSIQAGSQEPTYYDIFACLQKHDVGTFKDFCGDFGYDADSLQARRSAIRTYNAVCKEYKAIQRLFGDILEELQEIQ